MRPIPAGPESAVYSKVRSFWTKLSERSMLNYPGVAQCKIALSGRSQKWPREPPILAFPPRLVTHFWVAIVGSLTELWVEIFQMRNAELRWFDGRAPHFGEPSSSRINKSPSNSRRLWYRRDFRRKSIGTLQNVAKKNIENKRPQIGIFPGKSSFYGAYYQWNVPNVFGTLYKERMIVWLI